MSEEPKIVKEKLSLGIVSIEELLKLNLAIPNYQRPYRWTTKSALTLFNDIYSAYKDHLQEYRIGTIILHKDKNNGDESNKQDLKKDGQKEDSYKYNIVDGQQRITTISILLYCLNNLLDGSNGKKFLKEIANNSDYEKLLNIDYSELSYNSIVENYQILNRKCKELDKKLEGFAKYLLDKCTFVKIVTDSEQEAFQFFDSQNSRGKDLAPHDLLKAYHLREMNEEDEYSKTKLINKWEDLNQEELSKLFATYLYPIIKWYRKESGLYFNKSKIGIFKGIKIDNNYNYAIYHKSSNWGIEQFNISNNNDLFNCNNNIFIDFQEIVCDFLKLFKENDSEIRFNQFQLNQPIIDGKRFFLYVLHYKKMLETIKDKINKFADRNNNQNLFPSFQKGQVYIKQLYESVLLFFADKFGIKVLDNKVMGFFYTWCYSFYLIMSRIQIESINNYALGNLNDNNSQKLKNAIPMFVRINEMLEPNEIDSIILNKPKLEENLESNKSLIKNFIFEYNGWK